MEKAHGWKSMSFDVSFGANTFAGGRPFQATAKATLTEGIDRIDFDVDVQSWDAFNARIRFAFPVPFKGEDFYEIPYGTLKREPYAPTFDWTGANGDWPAINWAGVQGSDLSVALFNKGTPSYKIEDDSQGGKNILLSVLRSPLIPTYLEMTDYHGMRDAGRHHFEFSLAAYAGSFEESPVVANAESFNAEALALPWRVELPQMPRVKSDCVKISALKTAEKGKALIIRLFEFRGRGGEAMIELPATVASVSKVNLLERNGFVLKRQKDGSVKLSLRPWEIATLRCELA